MHFTVTARRLGVVASAAVVVLSLAYSAVLAAGLLSLSSPDDPIGNPFFPVMELLIIAVVPAMVIQMVAVHAWASGSAKVLSLTAVVFMALLAALSTTLHFVILTLSQQAEIVAQPWWRALFSFEWPSAAYALDILAWDVFFSLSMLFAAPVFRGTRLTTAIRALMQLSGVLALLGLMGVAFDDIRLRSIGIAGYAGVFPIVAALLGILFYRTRPVLIDDPAEGAVTRELPL
jgi:hypothetical protein